MPRRIHIVGGPCSGKSTLATWLSTYLRLPAYDLDAVELKWGADLNFRPHYPFADRCAEASRIASQPAWITEGSYLWWTDELLHAADIIIWLDLPWRTALPRVIVRHIHERLADEKGCGRLGAWLMLLRHPHLRPLLHFASMARGYYRERIARAEDPPKDLDDISALTHDATIVHLAPFSSRVVRCRRPEDVRRLKSEIGRRHYAEGQAVVAPHDPSFSG